MKIEGVKRLESSFLSVEKDLSVIVRAIFDNERLKKLLYYNTKDALSRPDLSQIEENLWPVTIEQGDGRKEVVVPSTPEHQAQLLARPGARKESPEAILFSNHVKIAPKLKVDEEARNYVVINFDGFTGNATNPYYRDNIIEFSVVCHIEDWYLGDFKLRPIRIAAEIDSMLNDKKMSGIGRLVFLGANQIILDNEFAGMALLYTAVHSDDDKVPNPTNPEDMRFFGYIFDEQEASDE